MEKWSENYETGISKIDGQHKHLFQLIDSLKLELLQQLKYDNYDKIMEVITELKGYTADHFQAEEDLMKEALQKYQDSEELANYWSYFKQHKREHSNFVSKIEAIIHKDIDENQEEVSLELVTFLLGWLSDHILKIDLQLPKYV